MDYEDEIKNLLKELRLSMKNQFNRHVSIQDLLSDRRETANFYGFGEGTSCYNNVLIIGDVKVGKNTWIGPYTILDGSGGKLSIGDFCSISSGVQIYTHNTVNWALTGGKSEYEKKSVRIGNNCYIGPNSIIAMGSTIGKCSIIGSSSFVNSKIPSNSIAFGSPAKIVGKVIVKGKNVEFEYF